MPKDSEFREWCDLVVFNTVTMHNNKRSQLSNRVIVKDVVFHENGTVGKFWESACTEAVPVKTVVKNQPTVLVKDVLSDHCC